jgi:N-formylglutamate deformylase
MADEAFAVFLPAEPETPVVVSVPHAGLALGDFAAAVSKNLDPRCDADLYTDHLYLPGARGAHVSARLSRFVCDLNRDPDDVSSRSVPAHPAPKNTDGRGFIWEVTTTGAPALARPLAVHEWLARKAIHDRYHAALALALDRARRHFGYAILVDGHSMPRVGRAGHRDPGRPRAEVVPGDRMGQSCAPALSRLVLDHFRARGFDVAPNDPYRGGYTIARHGRPEEGVHAIQIELRRDLYMDEDTQDRPEQREKVRAALADLLRRLDGFDPRG